MSHSKARILVQISGSIAAYKACDLISRLVKEGHSVRVVTTNSAFDFVGPSTLEGLTGFPLLRDMGKGEQIMAHIDWARWADLAIVCPATANIINKLSHGIADDTIGAIFLAWERTKPYLIAPAMNSVMFAHPSVQESMKRLTNWGVHVLPTGVGALACGETGLGRLLEPDQIHQAIQEKLNQSISRGKILITSGATREMVDGVRYLTNFSTGTTGARLALDLATRGFEVSLLHGVGAKVPDHPSVKTETFYDFKNLDERLKNQLGGEDFQAVVHLAAISDYSVDAIEYDGRLQRPDAAVKLPSDGEVTLKLRRNHKIIERLKSYSRNPGIKVVGFKLTHEANADEVVSAVQKLFSADGVDYVVHNHLSDVREDERLTPHRFQIFNRSLHAEVIEGKERLSQKLGELL